ncbi:uncharacterized protein PGTG_10425 [Puccinia graminis f. sp. tritici CRL 75-36-700-3]|uniref:Uncharacterized protein n=1 Tax=Puccinia graminis f. sp. tritici (strain CRL 75-36-700-3 / race SCCL) TaxID=418459 RepID=E3KKX9_PUCGT|nr:uncharacterized protein PGTG_10425 [Puccinia graminis f. sp. tritici CRL 75-36-700-3]EFP84954.1 hypothetical protein PGTG_10425 [Puccinia graminis f. sp. tritici CRL 75-36-700-3]
MSRVYTLEGQEDPTRCGGESALWYTLRFFTPFFSYIHLKINQYGSRTGFYGQFHPWSPLEDSLELNWIGNYTLWTITTLNYTTHHQATRNGLWISAILWQISASANGFPPADADADVDVPFPLKSWRMSGYPSGYPPI